ncbi:hypothetical protein NEOLEDRAFT_591169 [Neolentinus lepideus HHB14362 ss-1]|uniref:Uncharacterized protein n=1 Tax=Neolentinus lepideus HHB14362 ss-1 TaxID=1314782 RepID=A0A165V8H7_9AGAM|nr:hypothetical protein NEOLEDRAFT_591169 [Neolentinus lepideus HHB14362 ss-1]
MNTPPNSASDSIGSCIESAVAPVAIPKRLLILYTNLFQALYIMLLSLWTSAPELCSIDIKTTDPYLGPPRGHRIYSCENTEYGVCSPSYN